LKYLLSLTHDNKKALRARNDQGETPKDLAIQFAKEDCATYLEEIEYDLDHPIVTESISFPAHHSAYKGDFDYLKTIIETGVASINERDDKASTPAHKASGNGQVEVLKWLIEKGANLSAVNVSYETPKDVAIRFGQLACVKLLGGDIDEEVLNEEESIVVVPPLNHDAKYRAGERVEQLNEQLEIAKLNYQQFGGLLKEDQLQLKQQKENAKITTALNQQLEYERIKREKLESQLDKLRIHVHNLTVQLEDTKEQLHSQSFVISKDLSPPEKLQQQKNEKKQS